MCDALVKSIMPATVTVVVPSERSISWLSKQQKRRHRGSRLWTHAIVEQQSNNDSHSWCFFEAVWWWWMMTGRRSDHRQVKLWWLVHGQWLVQQVWSIKEHHSMPAWWPIIINLITFLDYISWLHFLITCLDYISWFYFDTILFTVWLHFDHTLITYCLLLLLITHFCNHNSIMLFLRSVSLNHVLSYPLFWC